MKIILIIQAIIIVLGAYYIYTLRQSPNESVVVEPVVTPEPLPETPQPSVPTSTPTEPVPVESEISGPNDAGMEWPIIEGELESR